MADTAVKAQRKQVQRDRATVQAEALKVNNPNLSEADRTKAAELLSRTVLKGTGLAPEDTASSQMLGKLTAELVKSPGTVIALGVSDTVKLKVSAADAATITPKIVDRLKKLV